MGTIIAKMRKACIHDMKPYEVGSWRQESLALAVDDALQLTLCLAESGDQ